MLNLKYLDRGMLKCKQILMMRPMLKKQFEDDVRTVFSAYKGQGAVEDFRDLVTETLGTSWRRNFRGISVMVGRCAAAQFHSSVPSWCSHSETL